MLDLIAVALRENGFEFERIDGQTPLERRLLALKTLHDDPKCTVMLASIGSIAEGYANVHICDYFNILIFYSIIGLILRQRAVYISLNLSGIQWLKHRPLIVCIAWDKLEMW